MRRLRLTSPLAALALAFTLPSLAWADTPEDAPAGDETLADDGETPAGDGPSGLDTPASAPDHPRRTYRLRRPADRGAAVKDRKPRLNPLDTERLRAEMVRMQQRRRRKLLQNSLIGSVGGFRVIDAGSGAVDTFRVMLGLDTYRGQNWLEPDRATRRDASQFSWSWTPLPFLEAYGFARRWDVSDVSLPRAFQVIGDLTLGVKLFDQIEPWLTVGGDVGWTVPLNTVSDIGRVVDSMGLSFRGNLTVDFRELEDAFPVPLIARLNLGYVIENSLMQARDLERSRYAALPSEGEDARAPYDDERRHRLTRAERFALQLDRTDRVVIGVGVEAPFEFPEVDMVLSPILEWMLEIPVDRRGSWCSGGAAQGGDGCLSDEGFAAFRQRLVLGARVTPPLPGFSLFTAMEIGLSGVNAHVHELHPLAPWTFHVGLAYTHDYKAQRRILAPEEDRK